MLDYSISKALERPRCIGGNALRPFAHGASHSRGFSRKRGSALTGFAAWLHQHEQRLAVGSQLLETRSGPVECCIEGSGPAVLILHGSPGGYDQALAVGHALGLKDYTLIAP